DRVRHDAGLEGEGPRLGAIFVLGWFGHRFGEIRLELGGVTRDEADEAIEDHVDDRAVLRSGREVRVQGADVGRVDGEAKDLSILLGAEEDALERRGAGDAEGGKLGKRSS